MLSTLCTCTISILTGQGITYTLISKLWLTCASSVRITFDPVRLLGVPTHSENVTCHKLPYLVENILLIRDYWCLQIPVSMYKTSFLWRLFCDIFLSWCYMNRKTLTKFWISENRPGRSQRCLYRHQQSWAFLTQLWCTPILLYSSSLTYTDVTYQFSPGSIIPLK